MQCSIQGSEVSVVHLSPVASQHYCQHCHFDIRERGALHVKVCICIVLFFSCFQTPFHQREDSHLRHPCVTLICVILGSYFAPEHSPHVCWSGREWLNQLNWDIVRWPGWEPIWCFFSGTASVYLGFSTRFQCGMSHGNPLMSHCHHSRLLLPKPVTPPLPPPHPIYTRLHISFILSRCGGKAMLSVEILGGDPQG